MNSEIAIFGRHLSASIRTFARTNEPDLVFPVLISDNELGLLEYHGAAELAVVKVAFDQVDRPFLGELVDEHGVAWLRVFQLEAVPFAALVCGPGQEVCLCPPLSKDEPAAMVAASRNGGPDGDLYTTEAQWAEFGAALERWLPTTRHETEGAGLDILIKIAKVPFAETEASLRADARAAFNRLKEPQYAQQ